MISSLYYEVERVVNRMKDLKQREIFATNLRYYLDFTGKTINDLSATLNVPTEKVQEWLDRMDMPGNRKIKKIADFLEINVAHLLEDKDRHDQAILERAYQKAPKLFLMLDQASPETADKIEALLSGELAKTKDQEVKDEPAKSQIIYVLHS